MMYRVLRKATLTLLLVLLSVAALAENTSLQKFIDELPVKGVRDFGEEGFFSEVYVLEFEQPLDHRNPDAGTFTQRVYVSHVDTAKPVVVVTPGYMAPYHYISEPSAILKANQIIVEHRFFGESKPDSMQYEYLDTWQSATDIHRIISHFKEFYPGTFLTTGISKGGQTVMYHSFYYPEDVELRIPYVAPLNRSMNDERIYSFLEEVGSRDCRKKILKFQKHMLENQDLYIPAFRSFSDKKGYTYELVGGVEKAFEYCVLEYPFAFWQWKYVECSDIPGKSASPLELIKHMNKVAGFDYFEDKSIQKFQPFFYQVHDEMGYYDYELEPFEGYIQHLETADFRFTLPEGYDPQLDLQQLRDLEMYIQNEADNYIFIYGEHDTWSATAVELCGRTNSQVFVNEDGSHRTRIKHFPEEIQEQIYDLIDEFLGNETSTFRTSGSLPFARP